MKLTEERKQMLKQIKKEWEDLFFDNVKEGRGIDKPAFEKGIEWLYGKMLKMKMPKIVYCDSWTGCILTLCILKNVIKNFSGVSMSSQNNNTFHNLLYNHIENDILLTHVTTEDLVAEVSPVSDVVSIWNVVAASIQASSGGEFRVLDHALFDISVSNMTERPLRMDDSSLYNSINASIREYNSVQAWDSDAMNIRYSIHRLFDKSVHSSMYVPIGNIYREDTSVGRITDFGWIHFYDFRSRTGMIRLDNFERYKEIPKSCPFVLYMYEHCVFAVHPPVYLARNAQGRLHSTEGPAVKFRDGTGHYAINGRYVPEWVFDLKDNITREQFLNMENVEIKAAFYEILGEKRMMEMLEAETVHTSEIRHANGEVETVELIKTRDKFPEIGNQPFAWVKVTCPSTGTNYLLGVEPKHTNAAEAVASLSMFDAGEYSFNFRT
jgi:hypothetical protein